MKKEIERKILNLFIQSWNQKISILKPSEPPDFLISNGELTIGIELVEIFPDLIKKSRGSERKKRESLIRNFHNNLGDILRIKFQKGFDLAVNYNLNSQNKVDTKKELQNFVQKIAELNQIFDEQTIHFNSDLINHIHLIPNRDLPINLSLIVIQSVIKLDNEILSQIIKKKSQDIINWNVSYDSRYLLMYYNKNFSNDFELQNEINLNEKIFDKWNKIFLFNLGTKSVTELN